MIIKQVDLGDRRLGDITFRSAPRDILAARLKSPATPGNIAGLLYGELPAGFEYC